MAELQLQDIVGSTTHVVSSTPLFSYGNCALTKLVQQSPVPSYTVSTPSTNSTIKVSTKFYWR